MASELRLSENQMRAARASVLFSGLDAGEVRLLPACLHARVRRVAKGEALMRAGDSVHEAGVVLSGSFSLVKEDFWGNRALLARVGESGVFAEAVASIPDARSEVSVVADVDSEALLIDVRRIVEPCSSACPLHMTLMKNLLRAVAVRAVGLVAKMDHVSKRTTREKLLSYFSEQALHAGSSTFELAFTRQELANYLFVERSAMSAELGRMAKDGLVAVEGRRITLLGNAEKP